MGNNNSCNKEKIVHPKFLGNFPKPWDISVIKPELLVYKQNRHKTIGHETKPNEAIDILVNEDLLSESRIIFITHGFRTTKEEEWLHWMKDAMLRERDQTVVIVGWGEGADIGILKYEQASANSLAVGQWLADYAKELRNRYTDIYIYGVGHSLGAHLMGNSGRFSDHSFNRVTGLDPAGVGFQVENHDKRLDRKDAKLVDVIHSDGKAVPYFGTLLPMALIDFYPNFGWNQPTYDGSAEKPKFFESNDKETQVSPYGNGFTISHTRALDYYLYSIENKGKFKTNLVLDSKPFVETAVHRVKASKTIEMGYHCLDGEENDFNDDNHCYYIMTNASHPWI